MEGQSIIRPRITLHRNCLIRVLDCSQVVKTLENPEFIRPSHDLGEIKLHLREIPPVLDSRDGKIAILIRAIENRIGIGDFIGVESLIGSLGTRGVPPIRGNLIRCSG